MTADLVLEDVDMDTSTGDSEVRPPPAHVAARIYKKTSADRRKSSAASSRRSSISSRHSHQSVLSAHGGPQSNHVAQHLRRASIIESRKARLADRAAHAEQVRLRAALAKAAPRGTIREERALAAQAAREKMLAEITARCEEEVRRAKKIAEENKEKKAAELAKQREEMEEKMAVAAKRRLQYQQAGRRPRTSSLPRVEETRIAKQDLKQMSKAAAAKTIQRQWRSFHASQVVKAFTALPLSIDKISEVTFEEVGTLLAAENVLRATSRILKMVGILEGDVNDLSERGSVRVFLSSFLVLGHPSQALSYGGADEQEQELLAKAKNMLETFDQAIASSNVSVQTRARGKFPNLFHTFSSTFHAWKTQDSARFIDIMVNQFVELDLILQTTKDDTLGGVAGDYQAAIRTNQVQLLARLKRFAGPTEALDLVRTAVRKARKQHAKEKRVPKVDDVPRSISSRESSKVDQHHLTTEIATQSQHGTVEEQASSFLHQLRSFMTPIPSNREVSHEIQVNGFFEVQQQPWTESRKAFTNSLRTAMGQAVERGDDLAASGWVRSMATLIRERLMNLVSQRHPLYERIDALLDIQLIDQSCRAGLFSYDSFFDTIANILPQICSPGRDQAVKAFSDDQKGDKIDRLFNLIDIIDLMSLDHINYAFRMAAPTVFEHGAEHERSNFEQDLSSGAQTLNITKDAWRKARASLLEESRSRDSSTSPIPGPAIYNRLLVELIFSPNVLSTNSLPETLHLDLDRLRSLRTTTHKIAATASILLTTKIRLRRNRETRWSTDADRIMSLDFTSESTTAERILRIIESSHIMPASTRDAVLNFIQRILPPAAATTSFSEPLTQHLHLTLSKHIFSRLLTSSQNPSSAASSTERIRVTTAAAEALARAGMPEFTSEITKMVEMLERVRRVDMAGHGMWYEQIAKDVEEVNNE